MAKFNSKDFNAEAFKYSVSRVPNTKLNELKKSRAVVGDAELANLFSSQNGSAFATVAFKGNLSGFPAVNYDGQTQITANSTKTMTQGVVAIGRAGAFTEKDFSDDLTGLDFMDNVAAQVAEYWDEINQDVLLAVLKGVFSMANNAADTAFVASHTYDVTGLANPNVDATTLNSATQKACGDHKKKFSLIIMHSTVATNLENLQLLKYLTYTDAQGIQRDLGLGTWSGKLVIIDDSMPVDTAGTDPVYTSYVLGDGAIKFQPLSVSVPYEMHRDPATNGGEDTLYTRERMVISPFAISYTKANQATLSPTNAELEDGTNWTLVSDGDAQNPAYINGKAIPIARILSKG